MGLIAFLVVGLLAGLIARAITPGPHVMGLPWTLALGAAGAFIGGLASGVLYGRSNWSDLHPSGIVFSVLGAVIVLVAADRLNQRVHM